MVSASPIGVRPIPRDPVLPGVLTLSALAHAGLILLVLVRGHGDVAPPPPREIPVELVQLPAKEPPKAAAQPQARSPQAKPPQAKPPSLKAEHAARTEEHKAVPKPPKSHPPKPDQNDSVSERMEQLLGPMPAIALPSESDTGTDTASYKQLVLSQVAKAKKEGRSTGIPGVASVSFTIGEHGEVVRCEVIHKSVDPKLDAEAVAMVRRGAPYPPPPPGASRDFNIGLRFKALPGDPPSRS